jgi:hypothetical protein
MSDDPKLSAALPRIMRAVQIGGFGGIGQLQLSSIPVPVAGPGRSSCKGRRCGGGALGRTGA